MDNRTEIDNNIDKHKYREMYDNWVYAFFNKMIHFCFVCIDNSLHLKKMSIAQIWHFLR